MRVAPSNITVPTGYVGEVVNFNTSSLAIQTSASAKSLATITNLSAGIWAIYGGVSLDPGSTLTVSQWSLSIGAVNNTENPTVEISPGLPLASSYTASGSVGPLLVNISTPTTYYLVSNIRWTGSGGGWINPRFQAVRIA